MIDDRDLDFTGRRVLVTGAAGGIGSAMAAAFAAHGGELILADIDAEAGESRARELGGGTAFHQYDQGDAASIAALAGAADPVDVLCNNAGMIQAGPYLEQSGEIIQKIIAINLTGPMLLARHVGEGMVARGQGVIVNTASQLAFTARRRAPPMPPPRQGWRSSPKARARNGHHMGSASWRWRPGAR